MRVRVLAFARLRELFGFGQRDMELASGSTLDSLWATLTAEIQSGGALRASTRFAHNGSLADGSTTLHEGDEVALMPPVGGG